MQVKYWATKLQSWLNQTDKANNNFKQNKLCMCSVRCSIGSVLNANCKIHCFGEPAIYFPKSFLRRNFHLNPTFSSPPRLFSHKYSFRNEVVFEYSNNCRPTFPFSFVLFLAVQDSSIGDLVTHSVSDSSLDFSVFRAVQRCCRPF